MPVFEITGPDGKTYDVEGPNAEGAVAALKKAIGGAPAPQEKVGFGERGQREQDMPETADVASERRIAQRMARDRPDMGAGDVFLQNYTFGLRDEAAGAGAGLAGMLHGRDFSEGYNESQEADRRLREEWAAKNPGKNIAATAGGLLTGGLGARIPGSLAAVPARTLGQEAIHGAAVGAGQGALYGAAEGDETEDGRLLGALKGGAIGGAVGGAAAPLVRGVAALGRPVANQVRGIINPEREAARRVAAAQARDAAGDGLDDAAYAAAQQGGQPVVLADRGGENTRALARSAANSSPEARQSLTNATQDRYLTQSHRVDDVLASQSTTGLAAEETLDGLRTAARAANRPAYQRAYELGDGAIWDDTLQGLAEAPSVRQALTNAVRKARDYSAADGFRPFNPAVTLDEAGDIALGRGGRNAYPNLQLWDYAKRELDQMARVARRGGADADAGRIESLARQLREHLDQQGVAGQAYQRARGTAAAAFGAEDAFDAGRMLSANGNRLSLGAARRAVQRMRPPERDLFREGYIAAERQRISKIGDTRDINLAAMASPDARLRAELALGPQGVQQLLAQLEVERAMQATRRALSGNSTTARQLTELGLAGGAGSSLAGVSTGDWSPSNLTMGAAAGGFAKWGKGRIDERLARRVGEMLATNDPARVQQLVRMAARSPQMLAAVRTIRNAMASAGAMATTGAISAP